MDFEAMDAIVKTGYHRTIAEMPRIKERIAKRISANEMAEKRAEFNRKKPPLVFKKNVSVSGGSENVQRYVKEKISRVNDTIFTFDELREHYFDVVSDGGVNTFYPTATYNSETNLYDLSIRQTDAPRFKLGIGGSYSSFSNLAFLSFAYTRYAPVSTRLMANLYLGNVYNSQKLLARFDAKPRGINIPLFWEATAVHNSYDYYSKNPGLIYEDTKPDFIRDREVFGQINIGTKFFANSTIKVGYTYANLFQTYYTKKSFISKDVPENMRFEASSFRGKIERNTFDYKMFPTQGNQLYLALNYVEGREFHKYATTSQEYVNDTTVIDHGYKYLQYHHMLMLRFKHIHYQRLFKHVGLGYHLESTISNQVFFYDYYSTLLLLPTFEPLPNLQGLFLESYKSNVYFAVGVMPSFYFSDKFFLRGELYFFQPTSMLNRDNTITDVKRKYSWNGRTFYAIASTSLVYQTPLGPVSLMASYYQNHGNRFYFSANFGFYLFNSRALD
jgi:NTE family protein